MIEKLTKEQEKLLKVYRDKWLKIGLPTDKCDRKAAEKACKDVYKIAGLKPPSLILWADSPVSGAMIALEIQKKEKVRGQVWDQMWDQVWDQVRGQMWDQVWCQVGGQAGGQVKD